MTITTTTTTTTTTSTTTTPTAAFSPQSKLELRFAIEQCLHASANGKCLAPNGPIGTWDVSSVTDMSGIFKDAEFFDEDISSWDVSEVTDMSRMFEGAKSFNQSLKKWDVSKVTRMGRMFDGAASFKQHLCTLAWVNAAARSKAVHSDLFHHSPGEICIYTYKDNTTSTTTTATTTTTTTTTTTNNPTLRSNRELRAAIGQCLQLSTDCSKGPHGPIGSWNVSAVTDMSGLFVDANSDALPGADRFNGDLSNWDVSRVTNMQGMFSKATSFNGDISKWDVSSVTDMRFMFQSAASFNGDISKWDVSSVTTMVDMFYHATSFDQTLCGVWKTSDVTVRREGMFIG